MKLLLSVALLGIFSISAEGLTCCTDSTCSTETTVTCSTETMCITSTILEASPLSPSGTSFFRGCASSSLCSTSPTTFSVNLGLSGRVTSAKCCDGDNCNSQTLPTPTSSVAQNGLQCFFCFNDRCDFSINCRGEEVMCIQGTDASGNTISGCASANVCQPARIDGELPFFEEFGELQGPTTCCDTDNCNDGTPQGFQCLSCTDSTCSSVESITCSTETMCITASILETSLYFSQKSSFFRGCASSSLCPSTGPTTFSVDLGLSSRFVSAECCDTLNCNSQALPTPNGLQCFFCAFGRCDISVSCQGDEDMCIQGTDMRGNPVRGCVSANVCQAASTNGGLPFGERTSGTTCCDTSLCNDGTQGLQCLACTDPTCSSTESVTCPAESMCITASSLFEDKQTATTETSFFRGCASSALCPSTGSTTFSVDLGLSRRFISAECCDRVDCNSQAFPTPTPPQTTNSLQCLFCGFGRCDFSVDCRGEEDRCIQGTDASGNPIRGCASSNACPLTRINGELPFFDDLGELQGPTTCCLMDNCNDGTAQAG